MFLSVVFVGGGFMSGKKNGIVWAVRLIIVSAIIFFVLQFRLYTSGFKVVMHCIFPFALAEWREFFMMIMSGIFTSSFVTLIMNYSDYENERRSTLENYFRI